jgi:hypothetical protein
VLVQGEEGRLQAQRLLAPLTQVVHAPTIAHPATAFHPPSVHTIMPLMSSGTL